MSSNQGARRRKDQRRVVVLLALRFQLGNATSDKVSVCLGGDRRQRVERGRLFLRRWGRVKGLGVFGEELGAVGGVEAFREDNQVCASLCGF